MIQKERLLSLDVFRRLTMAMMILVENSGSGVVYTHLRNARPGDPITVTLYASSYQMGRCGRVCHFYA